MYVVMENFTYKPMWAVEGDYNELKKHEMYDSLVNMAIKKEDIISSLLQKVQSGLLEV